MSHLFRYKFFIPIPKNVTYSIQLIRTIKHFRSHRRFININSNNFYFPFVFKFFYTCVFYRRTRPWFKSTKYRDPINYSYQQITRKRELDYDKLLCPYHYICWFFFYSCHSIHQIWNVIKSCRIVERKYRTYSIYFVFTSLEI